MLPARIKLSRLLLLCSFLFVSLAQAADYFVSPEGSDSNAGDSIGEAWRTIGKANRALRPGDTVHILGGKYVNDPIRPDRSGTSSGPISYVAYQGEEPVLTSDKRDGLNPAIDLTDRDYIIVDGINVDGVKGWPNSRVKHFAQFSNTSYSAIRNGHFQYATGWHGVRMIDGSHHNEFVGNYVDLVGAYEDENGQDSGDNFQIKDGAHHNLAQGNVFRRGAHNLLQVKGSNNVIRDNVFDNDWSEVLGQGKGGRNLSLMGKRNLFERNVVRNSAASIDEDDNAGMKTEGSGNIVRRNYIFANRHEGITSEAHGGSRRIEHNRIYHNTLVENGGPAWGVWRYDSGDRISGNVFKNNIVYRNRRIGDADLHFRLEGNPAGLMGEGLIEGNLIATDSAGDAIVEIRGGGGHISIDRAEKDYPNNFRSNIQAVPTFVVSSPREAEDLALAKGSRGIDEALPLTYTANAGSGKVVQLRDAGYFSDGFDVASGDRIRIGGGAAVRVVDVDYSAHTVTLATDVEWEENAPVSLDYSGAGPDIGAYEAQLETPPAQRRPKAPGSFSGVAR